MNNHISMRTTLVILLTMIPASMHTNAHYTTIQERQNAVTAAYTALVKKWEPALNDLSEDSLRAVLKNKKQVLKAELGSFDNNNKEELKSLINDLDSWPFKFACTELDQDIRTLFALSEEARILNMNSFDATPFQEIRARMDTLPCLNAEQQRLARFLQVFKKYIIGLGIAALGYVMYKNDAFESIMNLFEKSITHDTAHDNEHCTTCSHP